MTQEGFERACHALMAARTAAGDKCYFPKVYVSQDSPSFTKAAADYYNKQQHDLYGKPYTEIEEVTFERAWKHTHKGQEVPEEELARVCKNVDSLYVHAAKDGKVRVYDKEVKKVKNSSEKVKKSWETRRKKMAEDPTYGKHKVSLF